MNTNTNIASITWLINNFKTLERATSPIFYPPSNENAAFKLDLERIWVYEANGNECYVQYIYLLNQYDLLKAKVECRISLVNAKGEKLHTTVKQANLVARFGKRVFSREIVNPGKGLFTENGALTIHCEVEILDDNYAIECLDTLARDYGSLLESSKLSDVILVAGGHELKAHKIILSTRSKVFSAMFEHDCAEKRNSRVDITDVDGQVLMQLLRFIYTGKVASLDVYAADLLVAADKYQLDQLKCICSVHLATQLTPQSVAHTLVLADLHHATQLKENCIEYITKLKDPISLAEWKKICERNLELAHSLFKYAIQK